MSKQKTKMYDSKFEQRINKASKVQLRHCINAIKEIKKQYALSPEQNRYIDKIVRNEMNLIMPIRPKKLPDYLTPSEIYTFKKICMAKKSGTYSMLGNLLISTGLRINEACKLDIRDIDFVGNQLKVVEGKGRKDRYVPVPSAVLEQLKHFIGKRDKGQVFVTSKGKPYSKRRLQQMMEECLKSCNLPKKLSTHSLRHTFACLCLSRGMLLEDIKLLMGHSSVKTTEIYAKLELGSIKDKYLQLMGEF